MSKQQTAIEWFYNSLIVYMNGDGDFESAQQIYKEAKEMEKEQIEKAFNTEWSKEIRTGEQYYNETYNK